MYDDAISTRNELQTSARVLILGGFWKGAKRALWRVGGIRLCILKQEAAQQEDNKNYIKKQFFS